MREEAGHRHDRVFEPHRIGRVSSPIPSTPCSRRTASESSPARRSHPGRTPPERIIGTLRHEVLDQLLIVSELHLRQVRGHRPQPTHREGTRDIRPGAARRLAAAINSAVHTRPTCCTRPPPGRAETSGSADERACLNILSLGSSHQSAATLND